MGWESVDLGLPYHPQGELDMIVGSMPFHHPLKPRSKEREAPSDQRAVGWSEGGRARAWGPETTDHGLGPYKVRRPGALKEGRAFNASALLISFLTVLFYLGFNLLNHLKSFLQWGRGCLRAGLFSGTQHEGPELTEPTWLHLLICREAPLCVNE